MKTLTRVYYLLSFTAYESKSVLFQMKNILLLATAIQHENFQSNERTGVIYWLQFSLEINPLLLIIKFFQTLLQMMKFKQQGLVADLMPNIKLMKATGHFMFNYYSDSSTKHIHKIFCIVRKTCNLTRLLQNYLIQEKVLIFVIIRYKRSNLYSPI